MADIKIKINLNGTASEETLEEVRFDVSVNNVSKPEGSKTSKNNGQNLISWGNIVKDADGNVVSKVVNGETITRGLLSLEDGYVGGENTTLGEQGKYDGFVMGVTSDKKFYNVSFAFIGENIKGVIIYGDRNANQFPTCAYIDNDSPNYIYSDDVEWAIRFPSDPPEGREGHEITFLEWNRANYNACITHIAILMDELVLDKRWIKSIETLSQSTGQPRDIYYGVTPSTGSLEILDINGEIKDYIEDSILNPDNTQITIMSNGHEIREKVLNNGQYSNDGILTTHITDSLSKWSEIKHPTRKLTDATSLYVLLRDILTTSGVVNSSDFSNMLNGYTQYREGYSRINEYLKGRIIPYPYIESDYVRNSVNKICEIAQLNVVQHDNGQITFESARPLRGRDASGFNYKNIIKINRKNIFKSPNPDIIIRNKYNKIGMVFNDCVYDYKNVASTNINMFIPPAQKIGVINDTDEEVPYIPKDYSEYESTLSRNENINVISKDIVSQLEYESNSYSYSKNRWILFSFNAEIDEISKYDDFIVELNENAIQQQFGLNIDGYPILSQDQNKFTLSNITFYNSYQDLLNNEYGVSNGKIVYIKNSVASYSVRVSAVKNTDKNFTFYISITYYSLAPNTNYVENMILNSNINIYMKSLTSSYVNYNFGNGDNGVDFDNNFLRQDLDWMTYVANNILEDYSNGIRTNYVSISCSDYYYTDGELAKNWENGEIIQVGDLVQIEGNDLTWRVTGRNFRKVGVPMIDLELQEVKLVD